eukprot:TRINITY_DN16520_c0_g1_i2.p3 TRINITY_DN16520_c0_g1~~TRINITY_DN16520_c0_g1_i2.p3  ORF type:complete len:160 (+),score=19.55 TRINITY_DN16520_c0_g1_i2:305-784(+)
MKTMYSIFFFVELIPIAAPMYLMSLLIYYWVDKYNFLKRSTVKESLSLALSQHMIDKLDYIFLLFGISNCLYDYMLFGSIYTLNLVIAILGLIYLLLPLETLNQMLFALPDQAENEEYKDAEISFDTDYDRENPVTKQAAMVKWLKKRKVFDMKKELVK